MMDNAKLFMQYNHNPFTDYVYIINIYLFTFHNYLSWIN